MIRPMIRPLALALLVLAGSCTPGNLSERPTVGTYVYRIGPGDHIKITTYNEDRLTGEFTVNSAGAISFPLLGTVPVSAAPLDAGGVPGKTLPEFNADLQQRLATGFMKNPQVSAEMVTFRSVYVLGEVQRPGEFPYAERLSVYALVAKAGGFTYRANQKFAYVRGENETVEHAVRLTSATAVQPGDTIRIPERTF